MAERTHDATLEIVAGTYEHFLLGFSLSCEGEGDDGDVYSLKPSFTNNSHCGSIRSICSLQKFIASGSTDEVIRLLNLVSRTEHGTLQQHNGTITCLTAYHSYLFSGSDDGTICIWKTGSWLCEKTLRAHTEGVVGLSVHPSGKLALSIGRDKALKTWNLIKGRSGYTTNLYGIADAVQWSTEGNFYGVSIANRLDVYSIATAKVVYSIPFGKKIYHIIFLSDEIVAIGGDKEIIEIHNVASSEKLTSFFAHKNRVKDMKYHEKLNFLITLSNSDGFIKIWNFPENKYAEGPKLVTELDTTCRVTCFTIWDKSLVSLKKKDDVVPKEHRLLQENESDEDEEEIDENKDDGEEMEIEEFDEPPKRKSKKLKPSSSRGTSSSRKVNPEEEAELEYREHRKSKRSRQK